MAHENKKHVAGLAIAIVGIVLIEADRRFGVAIPALAVAVVSLALAAWVAGLRTGLVSAGITASYLLYINPAPLGEPDEHYDFLWTSISAIALFAVAFLIGKQHDQLVELRKTCPETNNGNQETASSKAAINDACATTVERLMRHVLVTQENARAYFSSELDERVAQELATVKMMAHQSIDSSNYRARIEGCVMRITSLLSTVRNLSMELRPAALDDLGLVSALRWYLSRQEGTGKLRITLDADFAVPDLPPNIALACFRIAQEAISNSIQHADANELVVRLVRENNDICLAIIDDGIGFDYTDTIDAITERLNFGLLAMRERTRLAGGKINVESAPGRGTTVSVSFPHR